MSITDELRLFAADPYTGWVPTDKQQANLRAIADRIDAECENACAEAYGNGVESVELPDMTSYVKIPVDADGVPVRIGDVMEGKKVGGGFCEPFEVVGYIMSNGELEPMDEHKCPRKRKRLRHHHKPTVEDVLRGVVTLCHNTWNEDSAHRFYDIDDVMESGNIADFAAKLQLRGDAE